MRIARSFPALFFLSFAPSITARPHVVSNSTQVNHRSLHSLHNTRRTYENNKPYELGKRGDTKYVFMHHIVGNTYSYTQADWADDIHRIQAKGVDALALNMGGDSWQRAQVASAYTAAASLGSNFKLFLSFDFTAMGCDLNDLVNRVNQFTSHPNQFRIDGRSMISSFSGDCLGNAGWESLKTQTNGYLMPFIWGLEGQFDRWPSLDTWYCWGCAWPSGNSVKTIADDNYYISQLGSRYATTVSSWMYTHYDYKNWYQRGDDWLLNTRWEQLIDMRDKLTFVEMVSWNDYGESHYFGPIKGDEPSGTTWTKGFTHTAWYDMSEYYITAFKTGSYPPITQDVIYYWARPHPAAATASSDRLGRPTGFDWTPDTLWAVVFATSTSTVTLACGSSSQTFPNVNYGVTRLKIPLAPGKITVTMVRNGVTVINETPSDYTFATDPILYNYNAFVGAAKGTDPSSGTPPTTPTIPASTSLSQPTTTSSIATPTPAPTNLTFSYYGCVAEGTTGSRRALIGPSFSQTNMTPQVCQELCLGYQYAAVEYGVECYCGNSLVNNGATGALIDPSMCNLPCAGDSSEICGAGWIMSVYNRGPWVPHSPRPVAGWASSGCFTDSPDRLLRSSITSQARMTTERCIETCASQGYSIAATEYGVQCLCGSQLYTAGGAGVRTSPEACNMPCSGDSAQICGSSWHANVYSKPSTPLVGVYIHIGS